MSPELINSKNGKIGYDGRSVDVWASGILLLVMLLGSFPFDHTEHPDPNTSEAHLEVWLQQVSKRWSEVPHMAEAIKKLSPECKDLLNRIFVIDAKKRITIEDIERHPWYRRALPQRYQAVLDRLAEHQKEIEAFHETNQKSEVERGLVAGGREGCCFSSCLCCSNAPRTASGRPCLPGLLAAPLPFWRARGAPLPFLPPPLYLPGPPFE
jgi:serine/threonine protein kinase